MHAKQLGEAVVRPASGRSCMPPQARFHARITPNRAISERGLRLIAAIVGTVSVVVVAVALHFGLWPVAFFFSADSMFLVFALFAARNALDRYEDVVVAEGVVRVVRKSARGASEECSMPLFAIAVATERDPDFGCLSVRLVSGGTAIEIARDLSPVEREDFRGALIAALSEAGVRARIEVIDKPSLAA